jgi:Plasmid pRiA4b ORF-3-like protein
MPPNNRIVRLRVQIDEVSPAVVRTVEVPAAMRLDDLHFVLQIAIGWQNCHPFEFGIGGKTWGLIDRDAEENPLPAESALLSDVIALGSTFTYSYVFGDDWHHTVKVEAVADADPDAVYPRLLGGEGRCPPADIGGPDGYETYLRAIADPEHLHHEGMVEWDEPDFDPAKLDLTALQSNLRNLAKYIGRRKAG